MLKSKPRFSPTSLGLFRNCRRCFWLDKVKGIKRPRGIFPSLPGGIDRVLKSYFDSYRIKGELPPELLMEAECGDLKLFPDLRKLEVWRNWRTGLLYDAPSYVLSGALDELLVDTESRYVICDYKTKGSVPGVTDAATYYGHQLDCYALMLEKSGYSIAPRGYLVYYSPKEVENGGRVLFNVSILKLDVDPKRAAELCLEAAKCLEGPIPNSGHECEYCTHGDKLIKYSTAQ